MPLQNLRKEIDKIDYQIHDLLNERAKIALKIGKEKFEKDGEKAIFYRPEREQQILEEISKYNAGPLSNTTIADIFKIIITKCREMQEEYCKVKNHD